MAVCRFWNVAIISYVHALHSCWAEATQLGPAVRRAKKAEAQQLHFKYYISRNPTTLRLVAEKLNGKGKFVIWKKGDAKRVAVPALAVCGIAAFLF